MNEFTAPVPDETDATDLVVTGALPTELSGRYFRNGPNPRPGEFAPHWFMGSGMLHGVRLRDGRAEWYRNRWVKFTDVGFVRPDGTLDYRGGPANTSVLEHSGRLFALVEQAFPYEIDRELNTIGYCDFGGRLTTAMTAHPKTDPVTGELHFFGYSALPPFLTYHRLSATGELVESRPIEVPGPTMMHDFAITENYLVWLDLPAVFDFALVGKTMPYRWSDSYGARIGLMPRTGGTVTWHEIGPCYVFHVGNAREENGQVVLDAVRYSRSAFQGLWGDIGGTADDTPREAHRLYRWSISPSGVREQQLDDREVEFPTHNEARTGRPNQWLYAVSGDAVIKYDTRSGAADVDARGDGWHVGEAVFVAASGETAEDAGWLVSIATHDHPEVPSRLLVHDATEVAAGPVATVHLPRRVPAGFHGAWIADATALEGEVR
ncbi:carotenoid cleavage dioxygenase [Hamadaea flava]|uniref:Dioxygenase n=1 Tax=Hamadaea flava TaxID=1742688 RepID=A0ABV8LGR9_9ACTN|nr:carotenoid oxygenase family protein [Hamadaea flava]MCP2324361.1 carotenoid cleavage dioxygenase [Hamadaea flava]